MLDNMIEAIKRSPVYAAIVADEAKQRYQARRADAARRLELQEARRARVAEHEKARASLAAAEAAARAKWERAASALRTFDGEYRDAVMSIDHEVTRIEARLGASADPRIDEAARAMTERWERMRSTVRRVEDRPVPGELNDKLQPIYMQWSNDAAIRRVVTAITAARAALERLKYDNSEDVGREVEAIEQTIAWSSLAELEPPTAA